MKARPWGRGALTALGLLLGAAQGAPVPGALLGEWSYGDASPVEYYDSSTGTYADQSGSSQTLRITADGHYERRGLLVVTTYNCTSKLFATSAGMVEVRGQMLALHPTVSHAWGYTCSPNHTYETRRLVPETLTWHLSGDQLILGDPSGKAADSRWDRSGR